MSRHYLLPRPEDFDHSKEEDSEGAHEDFPERQMIDHSSCRRSRPRLTLALQIYIAILATAICALQLARPTGKLLYGTSEPSAPSYDNGMVELAFSRDLRYMSLDHRYDDLWEWGNMSTLRVTEPELGTGEQVDAAISMFHQLHCLSSFRTALQGAYEGHAVAFDWHDNGHWPHCLDYLRNAILCSADGTLELPRIIDGKRTEVIDGAHDKHRCTPNEALFRLQGIDRR